MPMYIICANEPYCNNPVAKYGDYCEDCKRRQKARQTDKDRFAWRWTRRKNPVVQNKHQRREDA